MNTLSSFSLNLRKTLSRISAGLLAAVLLASGTPSALGAPSAQVSGDADVAITDISASHSSSGAEASAETIDDSSAALQATLSIPGAWACFSLTVENRGTSGAVLSQVVQQDETADPLLVSFGISDHDAGELLAPGEQCTVSIVVELDPELTAETISSDGDFNLSLVYDAAETTDPPDSGGGSDTNGGGSDDNGASNSPESGSSGNTDAPRTADTALPLLAGVICVGAAAALTLLLLKRRRKS